MYVMIFEAEDGKEFETLIHNRNEARHTLQAIINQKYEDGMKLKRTELLDVTDYFGVTIPVRK